VTPRPLNPAAAVGFQRAARLYEQVRPDYPEAVGALLARELGVGPGTRVLDLAAGTGKFSRLLLARGATVVAVEPVAAMRAQLAEALPDVELLEGRAEAVPLPDASVDVVTVAQAFHWFEAGPALAEIARVLRPGGGLALVWNVRDESTDWVQDFTELVVEVGGGRPYGSYTAEDVRDAMEGPLAEVRDSPLFGDLAAERFHNPVAATVETVVDRAASTSFIASLPDEQRRAGLARVRALLDAHPSLADKDEFEFPHHTDVFWCRLSA
jgi:ubiquinone/menaquinone biosynthesis C-methylase UbiE